MNEQLEFIFPNRCDERKHNNVRDRDSIVPYPAIRFTTDELDEDRTYTVLVRPQYDLPTRTMHGYRVEAFHSDMVCDPDPLCTFEARPDAIDAAAGKMDELTELTDLA